MFFGPPHASARASWSGRNGLVDHLLLTATTIRIRKRPSRVDFFATNNGAAPVCVR